MSSPFDTPEAQRHAEEATALREMLELPEAGRSERESVHPTRDGRGAVTLTFAQTWDLLGFPNGYDEYLTFQQEGAD